MLLADVAGTTTDEVTLSFPDGQSVLLDDLGLDRAPWPTATVPLIAEALAGDDGGDDLLSAAVEEAMERQLLAEDARDDLVAEIGDLRRTRILANGHELDRLARCEGGLERSLPRALHELQRLQAARQGGIAPLALDVDLAVS
jgi:hypothetical protein